MNKDLINNKLKEAEGFIFDLDGTLIDSERVMANLNRELLNKFGTDKVNEYMRRIRGGNLENTKKNYDEIFGHLWSYEDFNKTFLSIFIKDIEEGRIPLKEGANEILEKCNSIGRLAIATSTSEKLGRFKLEHSGLKLDLFHSFIFGDQVKASKPEPDIFLKVAEDMGVKAEKCIVFEDSNNGCMAGINGKFTTIMIKDITEPSEEVINGVVGIFNSLLDIVHLMEEN